MQVVRIPGRSLKSLTYCVKQYNFGNGWTDKLESGIACYKIQPHEINLQFIFPF